MITMYRDEIYPRTITITGQTFTPDEAHELYDRYSRLSFWSHDDMLSMHNSDSVPAFYHDRTVHADHIRSTVFFLDPHSIVPHYIIWTRTEFFAVTVAGTENLEILTSYSEAIDRYRSLHTDHDVVMA